MSPNNYGDNGYGVGPYDGSPREPIKVVGDILVAELGLAPGQVMLGYQKWNIQPTKGLYIALSYVSGKAIANNNYAIPDGEAPDAGMTEIQQATMHYLVQIDAMSFSGEARVRKEEIVMALRSLASEAAQEINNMQLGRIPSEFVNASSLEDTAFLHRYTMTIALTTVRTKTKTVADYYSQFQDPEVKINE